MEWGNRPLGGEVGGRRNACAVTVRCEELAPAIADRPIDWIRTPSKGPHLPSHVWSIDLWGRLVDSTTWMMRNPIFFFWSMLSVHVIFTDLYTLKICTEHGALLTARLESFLLKPSHSSLSSQSLFFLSLRSCHRCIFCDVAHDAAEVSSESSIDLAATRTCIHRYLPASSIT